MRNKIALVFSLLIASCPISAFEDLDINFSHKPSSNKANYWRSRHQWLPSFPAMSDQDLLAFNVAKITTKKVFSKNGEPIEEDDEISTGFFVWSSYESSIRAVEKYYGVKR
jgi:hypothetical protein